MTIQKLLAEMNELKVRAEELKRADIYLDRAQFSDRLVRLDEAWRGRLAGFTSFEEYLEAEDDRPHYPLKPEYRLKAASDAMEDQAELYQLMLQRARFL